MEKRQQIIIRDILVYLNPFFLLSGILSYLLGSMINGFLGNPLKIDLFLIGLALILTVILSAALIRSYVNFTKKQTSRKALGNNKEANARMFLLAGLGILLMFVALWIMLLQQTHKLTSAGWILTAVLVILALVKCLPKMEAVLLPYQCILNGFLIAAIIPGFSLALQSGELHRLLVMVSLPLMVLYIAVDIALAFPLYAEDIRQKRESILILLGWPRGLFLHNFLILLGFLSIGVSSMIGLPWPIAWPVLLILPIGVFQIWQLYLISRGGKPNWLLLRWTAYALFVTTLYMMIFAFWIN